jgi:hypothetical protein
LIKPERLVGIFALLATALSALILARPHFTNASQPQRGMHQSVVAIQVIQSLADVDDILSDAPSPDREVMRLKQYLDFGFIAAYLGLFLTLSYLLAASGSWARIAGIAAGICALGAATFDVLENLATLRILDVRLSATTSAMMNAIRSAAFAKWSLLAVTLALLSTYFLRQTSWTRRPLGALLLIGAALQAYGLANNVWLERQGYVLGAALVWLVALFFRVR